MGLILRYSTPSMLFDINNQNEYSNRVMKNTKLFIYFWLSLTFLAIGRNEASSHQLNDDSSILTAGHYLPATTRPEVLPFRLPLSHRQSDTVSPPEHLLVPDELTPRVRLWVLRGILSKTGEGVGPTGLIRWFRPLLRAPPLP